MKIAFFGSGKFAVTVLESLHRLDHEIALIVTQPDKKRGRHLHLAATPVKEYALAHGLELFQPEDVNAAPDAEQLKQKNCDLFIVVSYGRILSKHVLSIPKRGCVNIHASLLPKYRGAAPIQWALINGEPKTGITFILMNERMDQGDILFARAVRIERRDRFDSLEAKLARLAARSLPCVLKKIARGRMKGKKQNEKDATLARLIKKEDGLIRWSSSNTEVIARFRGCYGWPGTFTYFEGKRLKILALGQGRAKARGRPGEIVRAEGDILEVACQKGSVLIKEVIPESHHRMPVRSFLAGHAVKTGTILGI